jgi:hypothetical protein
MVALVCDQLVTNDYFLYNRINQMAAYFTDNSITGAFLTVLQASAKYLTGGIISELVKIME